MGVNAMYFESGDELAVKRLVERNWRRCQKLTQYVNLKDYFWKRLETPGKHGYKKQIFRSSLGDFIHLTLYVVGKKVCSHGFISPFCGFELMM